ncbi:uncharacterized protein LOC128203231 isoform X2 [Mya arenaria]|uniref:uncharacterized protein LOC128203231 isoform X2 n=1 Tax=Mya arenaria TaxID=6604 RepID=UPI0022DEA77E|nr:uncharacterized protein LOC128203231 isoform X2 [Mya arenaria]
MADQDDDEHYEILQEHFYLLSRYLLPEDFLDALLSHNVINIDEKELIMNQYVNQNRRQRANKFIEILMTKGARGYKKFVELLEYRCPHVYEELTGNKPRDPPSDFQRNRQSDRLRIIHELPNLLEHIIKDRYLDNSELEMQLSTFQSLLKEAKDENMALEKELETLKSVRCENEQLRHKIGDMNKTVSTMNDENHRWMKKAYDHSERENELKDLNQELRIKYDELQQKQAESQNLPHQPQPPQKHPDLPSTVQTRIGQHIAEQKNILQDQVAELQMHSEELTKRFQNSDEECRKLNEKVSELKREVFTLSSIKRTLEKQKKNADKQCDLYHAQIMEKGTEIVELQTQRIQDTRRLHDLQQQKNRWIDEKHEAEKENQRLRNEIDLLRCQIRSSGSSQASCTSEEEESKLEGSSKNKSKIFTRKVQIQKQYSGEKFAEILAQQRQQKAQRKMSTETPAEDNKDLTDVQKASTLPSFAKESPEDLFNKEVAWFRYSRNDYATNKPRLEQSDSMIPHLSESIGSRTYDMGIRDDFVNHVEPLNDFNRPLRPGPVTHTEDHDENSVTDNSSSVYVARKSDDSSPPSPCRTQHFQGSHHDFSESSQGSKLSHEPGQGAQGGGESPGVMRRDSEDSQRKKQNYLKTFGMYKSKEKALDDPSESEDSDPNVFVGPSVLQPSEIVTDFPCLEVDKDLFPKAITVIKKPGLPEKAMNIFRDIKFPVFGEKRLEIIGGNHTGFFISKVNFETQNFSTADKILSIKYSKVKVDACVCCLDDVHQLLSDQTIQPHKKKDITLEVRRSEKEFALACKWMDENHGSGDYFYIKCNVKVSNHDDADPFSLSPGDIFLVKVSHPHDRSQVWGGHLVNPLSGRHNSESLCWIPDLKKAEICRLPRSTSTDECKKLREGGVRLKGRAYEFVLPMRACVKLPVYIVCHDEQLATALLGLLSKSLPPKDFVVDVGGFHGNFESTDLNRRDQHLVRRHHEEFKNHFCASKMIQVLLNITCTASASANRTQYGAGFDIEFSSDAVTRSQRDKEKLLEKGQYFEELSLPDIANREELVDKFKSCINSAQRRILWLTESELDPEVVKSNCSYLIQDVTDMQTNIQQALSIIS